MLDHWLYIGLFFVVAMLLPGAAIFLASILGSKETLYAKKFDLRMRHRDGWR